jgi:hypothetical protein
MVMIRVTARITDDLAGMYYGSVGFRSPSGRYASANFDATGRVSGSALDGIYEYQMTVPQFAEAGTWRIESAYLYDQVHNFRGLSAGDLEAAGFPTSFEQIGAGDGGISVPPSPLGARSALR